MFKKAGHLLPPLCPFSCFCSCFFFLAAASMYFNAVYMKGQYSFCLAVLSCVSIYTHTPLQLYQSTFGEVLSNTGIYPIIALHIGYNFGSFIAAFGFIAVVNSHIKIYYLLFIFQGA